MPGILTDVIAHFFEKEGFVIVSTVDEDGSLHNSCKGIVKIDKDNDEVYLLDLYRGRTYKNLKKGSVISITAVDEHKFRGYSIKGSAKLIEEEKLKSHIVKAWEERITHRVTSRVLKNIKGEKGHPSHPEILLPKPQYLIIVKAQQSVDLTPQALKQKGS